MIGLLAGFLFSLFIGYIIWQRNVWKFKATFIQEQLIALRKKIKKRNLTAVDLDLATLPQIFQELSRRGSFILLVPRQQDNKTFVETFSAQMSASQTMDVLRVAYTGIADHLGELPPDSDSEGPENI